MTLREKDQHNRDILHAHFQHDTYPIFHEPYQSPQQRRYRNKVNVVFGKQQNMKTGRDEVMVGVYHEKGSRLLRPIYKKEIASNLAVQVSKYIEDWVRKYSQYEVYDFLKNEGLWRNFTIRENHHRQVMIIFHIHKHPDFERWLIMEFPLLIQHIYLKSRQLESDIPQYSSADSLSNLNQDRSSESNGSLIDFITTLSSSSRSGSGSGSETDSSTDADEEYVVPEIPFELVSVYYQLSDTNREMMRNDEFQYFWGDHYMLENFSINEKDKNFAISPGAFFQINYYTAKKIYQTLANWIMSHPQYQLARDTGTPMNLWDLCCGTGIISIYLGDLFDHCIGIDCNSYGIEDANRNVRLNSYNSDKYRYICGKVEEVFADIYQSTPREGKSFIVINPPRRGLYPIVLDTIDRMTREINVPSIYYISCCVETLKRDLDYFAAKNTNYQVYQYITIDQFPGTDHSEVIVELRKID